MKYFAEGQQSKLDHKSDTARAKIIDKQLTKNVGFADTEQSKYNYPTNSQCMEEISALQNLINNLASKLPDQCPANSDNKDF